MKIFRVISNNEKEILLENKCIFFESDLGDLRKRILFKHPEDYKTGKFFFLTFEEAFNYGKMIKRYRKNSSILELEIEEKEIYKYLGFGFYYYPDYDENGRWNDICRHTITEILLPYIIVDQKIKDGEFNIITCSPEMYSQFSMPKQKERPKYIVELAETLCGFIVNREDIVEGERCFIEDPDDELNIEFLNEAKAEYKKYEALLPQACENFFINHKNYKPSEPYDELTNCAKQKS